MITVLAALVLSQGAALAPDPVLAKASRQEEDGWIVIKLEGQPREVGYQQGALLSNELGDTLAALKFETRSTGKDWNWYRETAYRLYWTKLDPEYKQEIQGIAEGAKTKGAAVDFKDVLAINAHIELGDYYLPWLRAQEQHTQVISKAPMACSAFVATGSETADGKVVMGHNFWWDPFMGGRWRVLETVKPANGHEFVMDTLPGFIHSGTDWAQNDQGILISETTISGFAGYDPNGVPEFQRMRKAAQYSSTLDDVVRYFKTGNNGGYASTWLLADTKKNEIGKLELGLKNVVFSRKNDGAYFGANYPEDPKLTAEEATGYSPSPDNVCELRRSRWGDLLAKNKGKVDAEMAKQFLADSYNVRTGKNDGQGSALCGKTFPWNAACNAKVTTTDMAKDLSLWARMGVPDGTDIPKAKAVQAFRLTGEQAALWPDMQAHPWMMFKP